MTGTSIPDSPEVPTQPVREERRGPRPLTPSATAFALLVSGLWGGNATAMKVGLEDAPPLRLAGYRFVVGGIVTVIWALATRQSMRPSRADFPVLAKLGVIFSAQIAFMNVAQDNTSASHGVLISTTYPLWTGVIAHFTIPGDRLTPARAAGTFVAYLGVVALFGQSIGGPGGTLLGDLLMVCSAALLGARTVYTSIAAQTVEMPKLLMMQAVLGSIVFLGAGLLVESDPWVYTDQLALSILYQGGVIAGFGFIGNMWLLKHYLPSGVAAISLTTPIWGVVIAHFVLGDELSPTLFVGLGLVIAGMSIAQWSTLRRARIATEPPV